MFEKDNTLKHNRKRRSDNTNKPSILKRRTVSDAERPRILFPADTFVTRSKSDCEGTPGTKNL